MSPSIEFDTELWLYPGAAAWHFVTLPQDISAQIKAWSPPRLGFGSIRVHAKIQSKANPKKIYEWDSSIFPDKKSNAYLLPIKADVRKKTTLKAGDLAHLHLELKCFE